MVSSQITDYEYTAPGLVGDPGPAGQAPFTSVGAHDRDPGTGATADIINSRLDLGIPQGTPGRDFRILDQIPNADALPTTNLSAGDRYQTLDDHHVHEWNGSKWLDLGGFSDALVSVHASEPITGRGSTDEPLALGIDATLAVVKGLLSVANPLTDENLAKLISSPLTAAAIRRLVGSGGGGTGTAVTGVTITSTVNHVDVGSTITLTAQVTPSTATDQSVTWSSSNPDIAKFADPSSGVLTGVAEGTVTVTVTTTDGGFTDTVSVGVGSSTPTPTPTTQQAYAVASGEGAPTGMPDGARLLEIDTDSLTLYENEDGSMTAAVDEATGAEVRFVLAGEAIPTDLPAGSRVVVIGSDSIEVWGDSTPTSGPLRVVTGDTANPTDLASGDRVLRVTQSNMTLSEEA